MVDPEMTGLYLEILQTALVLLGGLVALYEYRRFRRYGAKTQFEIDFEIHSLERPHDAYLLDIHPIVRNMGQVRQYFPIIQVWAKALKETDVTDALKTPGVEEEKGKISLKGDLLSRRNIVKDPDDPYFVDPGVTQPFPHRAVVANPGEFLLVAARFYYTVPRLTYLWLRLVICLRISKYWRDHPETAEHLIRFRVHEYHIISRMKRVHESAN